MRLVMLQGSVPLWIVLTGCLVAPGPSYARASERALVEETTYFHFFSDESFNQHNYLYGLAQSGTQPGEEEADCLGALPTGALSSWREARAFYSEQMGERHHRNDPIMRWLRFHYSGMRPDIEEPQGVEEVLTILEASRPAYVSCFWQRHDALNRGRASRMKGLLDRYGDAMAKRLESVYETEWPRAVVVDLMPYSDSRGANTISSAKMDAPHMTITNDPGHRLSGISAFEILFHETSHHVFGEGHGMVTGLIVTASEKLGVKPPRDLWHAVSFYTTGRILEAIVVDGTPFQAYWKQGVMDRAWPTYREPIVTHWGAAVDGRMDKASAIEALVRDVLAAPRDGRVP